MKTRILTTALIATAIMVGCNHNSSKARIKKTTGSGSSNEYFYTADNKLDYSKTSGGTKTVYKFSANKVEEQMVDSATGQSASSTFFLNAKGLADSIVTRQGPRVYVSTFKHDADGFITEISQYGDGNLQQTSTNVIKDGNTLTTTVADGSGVKLGTIYFDYYMDKDNSINYDNQGLGFLGSDSKKLLKKIVQVRATGDTIPSPNYTYQFDDKGRVSKKLICRETVPMDSIIYTYY